MRWKWKNNLHWSNFWWLLLSLQFSPECCSPLSAHPQWRFRSGQKCFCTCNRLPRRHCLPRYRRTPWRCLQRRNQLQPHKLRCYCWIMIRLRNTHIWLLKSFLILLVDSSIRRIFLSLWLNKIIGPIRPIKLIKNRPIRFRGAFYFPLMQNDGKFDFATAKRIFRRVQVHCTCRGPAATLGCPQDKKERRRWAVRGTKRSIAPAVVQRRRWAVRGTKALRRTKNPLPENR